MVYLQFDPEFADYNFCELWDPAVRGGPDSDGLYRLMDKARKGDLSAHMELTDTVAWTLRPETWECFQREHGFRPVSHQDWFYAKLMQFFEVLLYDHLTVTDSNRERRVLDPTDALEDEFKLISGIGPTVEPEELERALLGTEHHGYNWGGLVQSVVENPSNRIGAARAWLEEQRQARERPDTEPRSGWRKNRERDLVILNCLNRGLAPESVCKELDDRTIPTPPGLHSKNIHRWADGWQDAKGRNAIQQLFAKVPTRKMRVKSPAISR